MFKFQLPISLTKEEMQSIADLAGQDLSMSEYLQKVIGDHIAGVSSLHNTDTCPFCVRTVGTDDKGNEYTSLIMCGNHTE